MAPSKKLSTQEVKEVIDLFKRRVELIKEGKIVPVLFHDKYTYESMKSYLKTDKSIAFMLGDDYQPGGLAVTENMKFSSLPKKDTKEGTKEERRREYEKKLKNIANEAVRTTNLKNLKGMTNDNIIQVYGKTRGEALIAKKKKAGAEESSTKTVEVKGSLPKGKHVELFLENGKVSVRKMSDKSVRVKGTVIDSRDGKSTLSYTEPGKESEKSKQKTENYKSLSKLDDSKVIDLFKKRVKLVKEGKIKPSETYDEYTFDEMKKMFGGMKSAVGAIRSLYPNGISLEENKAKSLSPFSKAMLSNDEDDEEILNADKFVEDDQKKEQARLDAEDERRRKDRESQKKAQEKQRKDIDAEQKRIWEEFEKRQNKKKKLERTLTPMQEIKLAGGAEKFAFAKTITQCSRVLTLDQVNAPTCWFNALMMVLFFSQNTRIAIANSLPYISEKWKFPIVVKISKLLEGYNKERASKYLYERLQPKQFLETLREHYPQQFPMMTRDAKFNKNEYDDYEGDSLEYMHRMLQFLEIQHLILSRPSMKSGKTEWSHYNYDLFGNKLFGDDPSQKQFNPRRGLAHYPKFVDTHHPVILTLVVENQYDKLMTERAGKQWDRYKTYPVEGMYSDSHAPIIKYNGRKYYLDSMILSSHNSKACNSAHAIAGVTCNGGRFLYNGWTSRTVDKGLRRPDKMSREACPLEPVEWAHTTNFCISKTCGFDKFVSKMETKEVCFSTMRNVSLIYVREDYVGSRIPSIPVAMDKLKQKQTEEGIFNNDRLIKMGVLKLDPRTRKYVATR